MRGQPGESLASVEKHDKPLEEATTSSLEALRAFTQGTPTAHEQGDQYALPYLQRAVELEPTIARAYASLGESYMILEQPSLAIPNYKKAFDLRGRVSGRERLSIEGMYYLNVSGELETGFATRSRVLLPRKILSFSDILRSSGSRKSYFTSSRVHA